MEDHPAAARDMPGPRLLATGPYSACKRNSTFHPPPSTNPSETACESATLILQTATVKMWRGEEGQGRTEEQAKGRGGV
eukprot:2402664-Alexandrium_andersonii.AAC.1